MITGGGLLARTAVDAVGLFNYLAAYHVARGGLGLSEADSRGGALVIACSAIVFVRTWKADRG